MQKAKKCKKAKWLSEEALQIGVKRREAKSKGEKERYTHLNAGFQRIASRDKKAFLSDQCREIEENNRMGKTRDLLKKIQKTKIMASVPITSWEIDGETVFFRSSFPCEVSLVMQNINKFICFSLVNLSFVTEPKPRNLD